jgi:hypothetical protein
MYKLKAGALIYYLNVYLSIYLLKLRFKLARTRFYYYYYYYRFIIKAPIYYKVPFNINNNELI